MIEKLSYQQLESRIKELEKELNLKQQIIDTMQTGDAHHSFHETPNAPHHMMLDKMMGETETDVLQQSDCLLRSASKQRTPDSSRRKARGMWTRTIDGVSDIVTIQDKNFTIIRANKAAHQLFNASHGDLIGKSCYEVFTGKSESCPNCPLLVTLRTGRGHASIIRHDKLNKVFHVNSSLIPAGRGGEQYLVHVAHDITKEMAIERNLQELNECFSKAFESNPAPMVISEISSGLLINVNQRWVEMLGYSKEEQIGKTSYELGIWSDPTIRDQMVAELFSQSSFKDYPVKFRTKGGETRSVLWSA
ncbi:MAG: PAS domain-containing protein [Desulforhopalus sp.]